MFCGALFPILFPSLIRGSTESTSGSSSGSDARHGSGAVDLKLAALESLHSREDNVELSTYALNGTDVDRLKELLSNPICPCKCTLPLKIVAKICGSFWTLRKESQDAFLWSLQLESGRGRSKFSIEGDGYQKTAKNCFYFPSFDGFVEWCGS